MKKTCLEFYPKSMLMRRIWLLSVLPFLPKEPWLTGSQCAPHVGSGNAVERLLRALSTEEAFDAPSGVSVGLGQPFRRGVPCY